MDYFVKSLKGCHKNVPSNVHISTSFFGKQCFLQNMFLVGGMTKFGIYVTMNSIL
jgi:hypothetical protein